MSDFRSVLIIGAGPAALQLAVLFKSLRRCRVGVAGRLSVRSAPLFAALRHSGRLVRADVQNDKHRPLAGECRLDDVFEGCEQIDGQWDTVILAVTADAYLDVLRQLPRRLLRHAACIALVSPTLGSGALVRQYVQDAGSSAETVSFSTYIGDTRRPDDRSPGHVLTTAVKRKVFAGSTAAHSAAVEAFLLLFGEAGITLERTNSPLEAETRNISLYVHPPLFMNDFSLGVIFDRPAVPKFVYKLFPEGPITPTMIGELLALWREISATVGELQASPVNLLKFMVDDNYPVRPESLLRSDIDSFPSLDPIHQQYLLYVRYASLLIDPFSEPDRDGRYFDFSAVPLRCIFMNHERKWDIPRMPKEDYYRIKIIQGVAKAVQTPCPTIDAFIARYERKLAVCAQSLQGQPVSDAFAAQSFADDIGLICRELAAH